MLRIVSTAVRGLVTRANIVGLTHSGWSKQYAVAQCTQQRNFGALSSIVRNWNNFGVNEQKSVFGQTQVDSVIPLTLTPNITQARTVTKFSLTKGKRKSVKTVLKRFYRLNWGIWIRTRAGRHKNLWRKTATRKARLRQHVLVNATQSTLLDKMVTKFWKRPHYYVDDPYNPYHKREEFPYTRKKPQL